MTNLALNIVNNKSTLIAIKNDLEIFRIAFKDFYTLDVTDGAIIYKLPHYSHVSGAKDKATALIIQQGLSLEAIGTGKLSNTFIVKTKGVSHV